MPVKKAASASTLPALPERSVVHTRSNLKTVARGGGIGPISDGVRTLIGGAMVHLVFGSLYCWGNYQAYAPGSLRFWDGQSRPGVAPDMLTIMPLTILSQAIAMPWGAKLATRFGLRAVTTFAGLLCALGSLLGGLGVGRGLPAFAAIYAGILGAGVGLGYTSPMVAGYAYFPNSKGIVSGIILGSFGIGGFLFNKIGTAIMNPEGFSADPLTGLFPESVTSAFGGNLAKMGYFYAATALLGGFLMKPMKTEAPAKKTEDSDTAGEEKQKALLPAGQFTIGQALQTRTFWTMWVSVALSAQGGLYVAGAYKSFATQFPSLNNDNYLATVGALGSIVNGVSRPAWGAACDKLGFRSVFSLVAAAQACLLFAMPRFLTQSRSLYAMGVYLLYLCTAANFTLAPTECYAAFGNAAVYGALYTSFAFAGIIGTMGAKALAKAHGTEAAFTALSAASVLSFAALQAHKRPASPP